jgi:hypothetical protein
MNLTLPTTGVLSSTRHLTISFAKKIRLLFLGLGLLTLSFSSQAQSEPEYIQKWTPLPEAEFFFDTAFAVIKCLPDSEPVIVMEVFNEGGNVTSISFELIIGDKDRNQANVTIPKFEIASSKYIRYKCGDPETKFLEIKAPEGIDPQSMFIYQIKYIKG